MKVDYIHHCGSDLAVVNAARVSFDKESSGVEICSYCKKEDAHGIFQCEREDCDYVQTVIVPTEQDKKLIKYLATHDHHSPFNHSFITMRVKAPIFVARQLVKHKFMPWNEISRRYVDSAPEFYTPSKWRKKTTDKKQGSSEESINPEYNPLFLQERIRYAYLEATQDFDLCPEQARMILPLNTYTEWYWSGTLGAWLDMLKLRLKDDTQQETREVAEQCADIIAGLFPVSYQTVIGDKSD